MENFEVEPFISNGYHIAPMRSIFLSGIGNKYAIKWLCVFEHWVHLARSMCIALIVDSNVIVTEIDV